MTAARIWSDNTSVGNLDAIERRRAIAARATERYASNPAVAAVLLAGSVARGLADERSDIELDVYWRRPPADDERIAAVEGAGWERVYAEVDAHEWADGYRIDGVKLDTSGFLVPTIDAHLAAALDRADTESARGASDIAAANNLSAEIAIARRHLARLEHGTPAPQEPPRSRPALSA